MENQMKKSGKCTPYYIAIRYRQGAKIGQCKIWRDYDTTHVWGSPLYKVLGYADTRSEAKGIIETQLGRDRTWNVL